MLILKIFKTLINKLITLPNRKYLLKNGYEFKSKGYERYSKQNCAFTKQQVYVLPFWEIRRAVIEHDKIIKTLKESNAAALDSNNTKTRCSNIKSTINNK